jgi:hypothetical protein
VKPLVILPAIAAGASLRTEPHVAPPTASTTSARPTGFLYNDIYLKHLSGNSGHPERPERLTAIWNGLQKAGLINDMYRLERRAARPTTSWRWYMNVRTFNSFAMSW